MADTVKVEPTPIQRNRFDVAVELTTMHYNYDRDPSKIEELFAKYYALARYLERSDIPTLQNLINKELLSKLGNY
jgi:hypothetical protein